jgi:hypothetical protein
MNRHGTAAQVNGFPGGCQAGYRSLAEAQAAWEHALTSNVVGPPPKPSRTKPSHADMFPRPPPVALPHSKKEPVTVLSSPHVMVTKQQPTPPLPPSISQPLQPMGSSYYQTRPVPGNRLLGLDEEEAFWVVVEGWRPGVY